MCFAQAKLTGKERYGRRPCIGYERNIFSRIQLVYQIICFFNFIVFVIAGHRRPDFKMIQQADTVPCILRGYQIHLPQRFQHTGRHVLQISDGCRT